MTITITLGSTLRYRAIAPTPLADAQVAALSSAIIAALACVDRADLDALDAVVRRELARAIESGASLYDVCDAAGLLD